MAKKLLAMVQPPKPLSEMTDEELDALADHVFDSIAPPADQETKPKG